MTDKAIDAAIRAADQYQLHHIEEDVRVSQLTVEELTALAQAAISAYLTQREADGWEPIETAPAEVPVIVFCPEERPGEQVLIGERSACAAVWRIYIDDQRIDPSHWMPLPARPQVKP